MISKEYVLSQLGLRTQPFAPDVAPDGTPLATDPFATALTPNLDSRLVAYYFDLYDWKESTVFGGFSRQGLLNKFPNRSDLQEDGCLLVLISGTSQTGRGSLVNLILRKIEIARGKPPLTISVRFNSFDP